MGAPEQRLQDAIARHRAGDQIAGERCYRDHLTEFPQDPTALHFLGLMRHQQNRTLEGIELMEAAVRADPAYVDAWSNLGIAFLQHRDFERALGCCQRAIELAPDFANAWSNLGFALRAKGALGEALAAWARVLELQPGRQNIAICYGRLLYQMKRVDEARAFYEKWSRTNPGDPVAAHMAAAMSGGTGQPARASDGYVRTTFDDFAESFDQQLENLQYRAPQILCQAAKAEFTGVRSPALNVLDLGCGTGLCGPLVHPMAERLVGVDLSCKMLAKAAARGCYQQLNLAEIGVFLRGCTEHFDIVLAADVLCYFGSLAETFGAVRRVLSPVGRFLFSLEDAQNSHPEPNEAFALKPHGRYEHHREYVESALKSNGFQVSSVRNDTLRLEHGEPVIGLIVVAGAVYG